MTNYQNIEVGGGDTATPLNFQKRVNLMLDYVDVRGKQFVDCGCGAGDYVLGLQALGAKTCGIEFDQVKVSAYQQAYPESGRVAVGDLESIGFSSEKFHIALLNEVLEHVPHDDQALREVYRILKPGGTLFVFSPNRFFPFESHGSYLKQNGQRLKPHVPFIPYIPVRVGQQFIDYPARNYWPYELRDMVKNAGFQIVDTTFVWQTFENISGDQSAVLTALRPLLRKTSTLLEHLPLLRVFGVSQVIVARRR